MRHTAPGSAQTFAARPKARRWRAAMPTWPYFAAPPASRAAGLHLPARTCPRHWRRTRRGARRGSWRGACAPAPQLHQRAMQLSPPPAVLQLRLHRLGGPASAISVDHDKRRELVVHGGDPGQGVIQHRRRIQLTRKVCPGKVSDPQAVPAGHHGGASSGVTPSWPAAPIAGLPAIMEAPPPAAAGTYVMLPRT
jgi:hypothetical protein